MESALGSATLDGPVSTSVPMAQHELEQHSFLLRLDPSMAMSGMLEELKRRGMWVNTDIVPTVFPEEERIVSGLQYFEVGYVLLKEPASRKEVFQLIRQLPDSWVPATVASVLCFALKYSEEQDRFRIVGLGSLAKVRHEKYPLTLLNEDGRILTLYRKELFYEGCRILVVRPASHELAARASGACLL